MVGVGGEKLNLKLWPQQRHVRAGARCMLCPVPAHYEFIGLGAMDVTKPCEFLRSNRVLIGAY